CHTTMKLSQHSHSASLLVLVQQHQFDARVRARLPFSVFRYCNVREHGRIEPASRRKRKSESKWFRQSTPPSNSRKRNDSTRWPIRNGVQRKQPMQYPDAVDHSGRLLVESIKAGTK